MKTFVALALLCCPFYAAAGEAPVTATLAADGVQRIDLVGGNYFFRPAHIIVKAHVPVALSVRLEPGLVPHSLVIAAPEAGISIDEKLGREAREIRFTPTAAGRYPFYCKNKLPLMKSHRDKGMAGTLEVVE